MKAKVERGSGFRGVLDYALGKDGGNACEIVGGNMSGHDARELAAEFALSREARPGVKKHVLHVSLALPPGEDLTSDKWSEIAADFCEEMGLDGHQFVAIRHHDTDIGHIHIIASRVGLDGSVWHGKFEARRAIEVTQRLEEKHGLTRTKGLDDGPALVSRPTKGEIEMQDRTGEPAPRLALQAIIDAALSEPGSIFDFLDRLEDAGVTARPNLARTGKMNGFSFQFDGIAFKGSSLGKNYGWKALQERGVDYEPNRDSEALRERIDAAAAAAGEIDSGSPIAADRAAGPSRSGSVEAGRGAANGSDPAGRSHEGVGEERGGGDRGRENRGGIDPFEGGDDDLARGREHPDGREGGEVSSEPGGKGVPADRAAGGTPALDRDRRGGSVRADDWNPVADRVADLAAGTYPADLGDLSGDPVTPAIAAKQRAWDQQHGALAAPAYRLTLMSRVEGLSSFNVGKGRGPDGAEKTYDASEVRGLIPYLSAQNARGRDIYLTPLDPEHHYLVVDDATPASLDDLIAAGYRPALVQESSANNRQAILKVPKGPGRDEQKAANAVVVEINRRFGDPNFSGVIHPFRMAGFSNKKPGRGNAFTRVLEAAGGLCARALSALEEARQRLVGSRAPAPAPERPRQPQELPAARDEAEAAFDRARTMAEGLAEAQGWTRDESRLDYRAAQIMAQDGWEASDVAAAILSRSPNLVDRHRDPLGYASRTAENAAINIRSDRDPQEGRPQGDRPEGPEM